MVKRRLLQFNGAPEPPAVIVGSHLGSGTTTFSLTLIKVDMTDGLKEGSEHTSKMKFENIKAELRIIVDRILNGKDLQRSFSSIYKDVELVILYKHSEQTKLADWILSQIESHLDNVEKEKIEKLPQVSEDDFELTGAFVSAVQTWSDKMTLLLKLFNVIDRAYLYQHPRKSTILGHGLKLFVKKFFFADEDDWSWENINPSIRQVLMACDRITLLTTRSRDARSEELASSLVTTMNRLNNILEFFFTTHFQKSVLSNYTKLQDTWMEDQETYMINVLQALTKESEFLKLSGFQLDFVKETLKKLYWKLMINDLANLLGPSIPALIKRGNRSYLSALVKLAETSEDDYGVNSMLAIVYAWGKFVTKETAKSIESCNSSGIPLIPKIVELWDDLFAICDLHFKSQELSFELRGSMSKAISLSALNRYVLVQLSKYCESFFKQSGTTDEQFSEFSRNAITVFKLVSNKRDFLIIYERDVSKRFLLGKNFNLEAERRFFSDILDVVGDGDESLNLTSMFKDIETSISRYSDIHLGSSPTVQFNALILESGHWPEVPKHGNNVILPGFLNQMLSEFTANFASESERTKLQVLDWSNYSFHQLTIEVAFARGSKELSLTLLQVIVLLLFENHNTLLFEELLNRTNLEDKLVKRIVTSLSSDRYPILLVDGTSITFNENFTDRSSKIRIPLGREKETSTMDDAMKRINKSHTSEIRAALVRVMKAEKSLTYPELLAQTNGLLSMPTSVQDMKVQIEYLITNEYLGRQGTSNTLVYIP